MRWSKVRTKTQFNLDHLRKSKCCHISFCMYWSNWKNAIDKSKRNQVSQYPLPDKKCMGSRPLRIKQSHLFLSLQILLSDPIQSHLNFSVGILQNPLLSYGALRSCYSSWSFPTLSAYVFLEYLVMNLPNTSRVSEPRVIFLTCFWYPYVYISLSVKLQNPWAKPTLEPPTPGGASSQHDYMLLQSIVKTGLGPKTMICSVLHLYQNSAI